MYDLLIRGGRIVGGTCNPWYPADVGVKDGSIAAIGRIDGMAERVIDAEGLHVAPGFIDVHCHTDLTVLDPRNLPWPRHGDRISDLTVLLGRVFRALTFRVPTPQAAGRA